MLTRCTRLPVPNCSDNQGRSHVHEATKNVGKRQYEEEYDSIISSLKDSKILVHTDRSWI